jgi:hypothetical protein
MGDFAEIQAPPAVCRTELPAPATRCIGYCIRHAHADEKRVAMLQKDRKTPVAWYQPGVLYAARGWPAPRCR